MDWLTYVQRHYRDDIDALVSAHAGCRGGSGAYQQVRYCDCGPHQFVDDLRRAQVAHPKRLAVEMFLEAALLAGVHSYDSDNYSAYASKLPVTVYVSFHPTGGMRLPQVLLAALAPWAEEDLELLESGCRELLPRWVATYDRAVAPGRGAVVLRGLAADGDLRCVPYAPMGMDGEKLPERVLAAYARGLQTATRALTS